jgi:RHS repeat-associated protein
VSSRLARHNLRARYYETRTGRFVSVDPLGASPFAPVSLHRYAYADLDPVNNIDPSGLASADLKELLEVQFAKLKLRVAELVSARVLTVLGAGLVCAVARTAWNAGFDPVPSVNIPYCKPGGNPPLKLYRLMSGWSPSQWHPDYFAGGLSVSENPAKKRKNHICAFPFTVVYDGPRWP